MPDESPYYAGGGEQVEATTESLRAEAKKWFGFADNMMGISAAMDRCDLEPTAFAVIDLTAVMTAPDQHGSYTTTQNWLTAMFKDASAKMEQFGDALNKVADEYDRTDGHIAKSFDSIATS